MREVYITMRTGAQRLLTLTVGTGAPVLSAAAMAVTGSPGRAIDGVLLVATSTAVTSATAKEKAGGDQSLRRAQALIACEVQAFRALAMLI